MNFANMKNIEILDYLFHSWNKLSIHQHTVPECHQYLHMTKNLIQHYKNNITKQDIQSFTAKEQQTLTNALEILVCC